MNLDERIEGLSVARAYKDDWSMSQLDALVMDEVKQLIRDVIQEITPERYTEDQGIDAEMQSHNNTVTEMEAKAKELGL